MDRARTAGAVTGSKRAGPRTTAPLVSVVVPTHQRADLLPRLLASVLGQDLPDLELVVVDDGSTDGTRELLDSCADPRVRVLSHPQARGVAHARNTGTAAARGRWVAWCDDDDVWAPYKLRLQLQALEATPGALWSNGGSAYVDSDLRLSRVRRCPDPATVASDILRINAVTGGGSGVMADRALVLSLGGFDTRMSMYADWDLWARLAHVAPLAAVDRPLVGYVEHSGGMSRNRLHLALEELSLLQESLERLRERSGQPHRLDSIALGHWMLRHQTGGRRRDSAVLPFRLVRHGLLRPWRVLPYSLVSAVAPAVLQRRWATRWSLDERSVREAQDWLATLRASVPAAATV
jgi:hypothetical protein